MRKCDRLEKQIKDMQWEIDSLTASKQLTDSHNFSIIVENFNLQKEIQTLQEENDSLKRENYAYYDQNEPSLESIITDLYDCKPIKIPKIDYTLHGKTDLEYNEEIDKLKQIIKKLLA